MTLGERIYQYRTQRRLSQLEVAEKLEVSRQSVSKWETDGAVPDLDKLVKLCELFGVSLDELVRGEPPKAVLQETNAETSEPTVHVTEETSPNPPERSNAQVAAGAALLTVGLLTTFAAMLIPGAGAVMIFVIPFVVCGILCLTVRRNAGAACAGAVILLVFAALFLLPVLKAFFEHF